MTGRAHHASGPSLPITFSLRLERRLDPAFFMTYDDVSQGLSQVVGNRQWESVTTPNQVESIVVPVGDT